MLKVQSTRVIWLLLASLLMIMLAISIVGATVQTQVADNDSPHSTVLFQAEQSDTGATAVIASACNGGSEGSCGG